MPDTHPPAPGDAPAGAAVRLPQGETAGGASAGAWRAVVEGSPDAALLSDSDGSPLWLNSAARALLGEDAARHVRGPALLAAHTAAARGGAPAAVSTVVHLPQAQRVTMSVLARPVPGGVGGRRLVCEWFVPQGAQETPADLPPHLPAWDDGLRVPGTAVGRGPAGAAEGRDAAAGTVALPAELTSRMRAALEATSEGVVVLDAEGRVVWVNEALPALVHVRAEHLVGSRLADWVVPQREQRARDAFAAARRTPEGKVPRRFVQPDGTARWLFVSTTPLPGRDGEEPGVVAVLTDVSEVQRLQAELHHAETHDPLTGLPGREAVVTAAGDRGDPVVLLVRLRGLAAMRAAGGSLRGPESAVVTAAERLVRHLPDALVARLDGPELAVVPAAAPRTDDGLLALAEEVRAVLAAPVQVGGAEVSVRVDVGVVRGHGEPVEDLLGAAGAALADAVRRPGAGACALYDAGRSAAAVEHHRRGLELAHALGGRADVGGHLELVFQPVVALGGREPARVRAAEALLRWHHPRHGVLAPSEVLPLAVEHGLEVALSDQVLALAAAALGRWRGTPLERLRLGVNLTAADLSRPDLVDRVGAALERTGAAPSQLSVEVTETAVVADVPLAVAHLRRLQERGVVTAVDDFGTGYASLSYLRQFPVQVVKIDRSFVASMAEDPVDAAIVEHVVALSRRLGLAVVAEGVETPAQADRLRAFGCGYAQGYLYSRALDEDGLRRAVSDATRG